MMATVRKSTRRTYNLLQLWEETFCVCSRDCTLGNASALWVYL